MADEVEEWIRWAGHPSVNVFVAGAGNAPLPAEAFRVGGLVPDRVFPFVLEEQPEEIERLGLISYDLDFRDPDADLRAYTGEVLRRLCAGGPAVAWAAFEGSFAYDELLTAPVAFMIYGYCVSGGEPVVAWDRDVLRGEAWQERIAGARAALDALLSPGPA